MRYFVKRIGILTGVVLLASSFFGVAYADDQDDWPEELENFQKTGESRRCLRLTSIKESDVLSDKHILFRMRNRKLYLSTLASRCPRLGYEETFMYKTSISQLCDSDIITVLTDSGSGMRGASCGLGRFEEIEEIESEDEE